MSSVRGDQAKARPKTRRQSEKEQRHRDLLAAAGRLFGTHGYAAVTLDDIGTEVGVSGQAIYRHFKGKQDLLGKLLLGVSAKLLEGGQRIQAEHPAVQERIERLIDFHVDFALESPEIIRVQEQEMLQLFETDQRNVRRMQRQYLEIWGEAVRQMHPNIHQVELRTRIHGAFGLINSTAHSMKRFSAREPSARDLAKSAATLRQMAREAINIQLD